MAVKSASFNARVESFMKEKKTFLHRIGAFLRHDPVLAAALSLAVISSLIVPPSMEYLGYIDFHVLVLLFSLMLVVAGLQKSGAFTLLTDKLLQRVKSTRSLAAVLVGVCFFTSMLITNDVALITFVPLAVMLLGDEKNEKLLMLVVVLQTIAANLGSGLTPLGNPQNLYLYSLSGMTLGEFLMVMLPPTALSAGLLTISILLIRPRKIERESGNDAETDVTLRRIIPWLLLFGLCMLAVLHVIHYLVMLAVVTIAVILMDRSLFRKADYGLLLTFIGFFIFIGNVKSIPVVSEMLSALVAGRELGVGVLLSQIISNVPAAMLLSGFTTDYPALLVGVNLGGLGTLIASMASMISYQIYATAPGAKAGKYFKLFTVMNIAFLAVLLIVILLLR